LEKSEIVNMFGFWEDVGGKMEFGKIPLVKNLLCQVLEDPHTNYRGRDCEIQKRSDNL